MVNTIFEGFKKSYSHINLKQVKYINYCNGFLYRKIQKFNLSFPEIKINPYFNIFQILSLKEIHHSKIIGKFIDPLSKHGYSNIFLKLFFKIVLNDHIFEYSEIEKWIITIEKLGRFDIRIRNRNNSKIIIIENKSNEADDKPNQLYRYWYNGIYKPQSILSKSITTYGKILYLSPGYWKKPDLQTITRPTNFEKDLPNIIPNDIIKLVVFSNEIVKWLSACLSIVEKNTELQYCIMQYLEYWREYHGKDY